MSSIAKYQKKKLKTQRGYTLIELSIAGAIIALLIYGTVKLVSGVIADHKANNEISELPSVITKMQKVYGNRSSFAGATQAIMVNNGAFPTDWVTAGTTTLVNRWSGPVTIAVATIGATPNNAISITTAGVPNSECSSVVPGMDDSVRTTTVNGTVVKADGVATDPGALGTACTTGSNTIVYTFSK